MSITYCSFLDSICILENRYTKLSFAETQNYITKKVGDLPIPEPENDYWRNLLLKMYYYDFSEEEAQIILNNRIEFIKSYYERLFNDLLTDMELQKSKPNHYKGPYLPNPQEIKMITNLDVKIDWNVPQHHQVLEGKKGTYRVNNLHKDKILQRWMLFQKEYRIFDIRPLIGERCCLIDNSSENGKNKYVFYRLLKNPRQYLNFLCYLGKDTPELLIRQVFSIARFICDCSIDGKYMTSSLVHLSGLEFRLLDEIYTRFGHRPNTDRYSSLLIGKRCFTKHVNISQIFGYYRKIPFKDGMWTKAERLRLIKCAKEYSQAKDLKTFVTSKERLPWREIFYKFKTRSPSVIRNKFSVVKQYLNDILTLQEKGSNVSLRWTEKETVKLIELIYFSDAKSAGDLNWFEMVNHFPGYTDMFIANTFYSLIKARVPVKQRKYFEDTKNYLYSKIKPVFMLNDVKRKERKNNIVQMEGLESSFSNEEIEDLSSFLEKVENEVISRGKPDAGPNDPSIVASQEEELRCRKYPVKMQTKFALEEDDIYWQELMVRHNFRCTYPPSLKVKLKFFERDTNSEEYVSTTAPSHEKHLLKSSFEKNIVGNKSLKYYTRKTSSCSNVVFGRKNKSGSERKAEDSLHTSLIQEHKSRNDRSMEAVTNNNNNNKDTLFANIIDYMLLSSEDECDDIVVEREIRGKKFKDTDVDIIELSDDEFLDNIESSENTKDYNRTNDDITASPDDELVGNNEYFTVESGKQKKNDIKLANSDTYMKFQAKRDNLETHEGEYQEVIFRKEKKKHESRQEEMSNIGVNKQKSQEDIVHISNSSAHKYPESTDVKKHKIKQKEKEHESLTDVTDPDDLLRILTCQKHKKNHVKITTCEQNIFYSETDLGDPIISKFSENTSVREKRKRDFDNVIQPGNLNMYEDGAEWNAVECNETNIKRHKKRKQTHISDAAIHYVSGDDAYPHKKRKKENHNEWKHKKLEITCEYNQLDFNDADYSFLSAANKCSRSGSVKKQKKHKREYADETVDKGADNSEISAAETHKKKKCDMEMCGENNDLNNGYNQTNRYADNFSLHSHDKFLDCAVAKKERKSNHCNEFIYQETRNKCETGGIIADVNNDLYEQFISRPKSKKAKHEHYKVNEEQITDPEICRDKKDPNCLITDNIKGSISEYQIKTEKHKKRTEYDSGPNCLNTGNEEFIPKCRKEHKKRTENDSDPNCLNTGNEESIPKCCKKHKKRTENDSDPNCFNTGNEESILECRKKHNKRIQNYSDPNCPITSNEFIEECGKRHKKLTGNDSDPNCLNTGNEESISECCKRHKKRTENDNNLNCLNTGNEESVPKCRKKHKKRSGDSDPNCLNTGNEESFPECHKKHNKRTKNNSDPNYLNTSNESIPKCRKKLKKGSESDSDPNCLNTGNEESILKFRKKNKKRTENDSYPNCLNTGNEESILECCKKHKKRTKNDSDQNCLNIGNEESIPKCRKKHKKQSESDSDPNYLNTGNEESFPECRKKHKKRTKNDSYPNCLNTGNEESIAECRRKNKKNKKRTENDSDSNCLYTGNAESIPECCKKHKKRTGNDSDQNCLNTGNEPIPECRKKYRKLSENNSDPNFFNTGKEESIPKCYKKRTENNSDQNWLNTGNEESIPECRKKHKKRSKSDSDPNCLNTDNELILECRRKMKSLKNDLKMIAAQTSLISVILTNQLQNKRGKEM